MKKPHQHLLTPLSLAIALSLPSGVQAYGDSGFALEEIVVTAQKREQSLQDVPIAVTAIDGDLLQQTGSITLSDVASLTPGLNISNTQSESVGISMRGIGSNDFGYGTDQSIPVYLDGVYMGNGAAIVGDLTDVARIEVLKGPQGTLFGRNAVGGAVSVTTQRPGDQPEGLLTLGAGSHELRTLKGTVNIPILEDQLFLRVNGSIRSRDGWQKNIATDREDGYEQDRWNGRAKLLWTPSDTLELEFTSDWQNEQDHAGYYNVIDSPFAPLLSSTTLAVDDTNASSGHAFLGLDPKTGLPLLEGPEARGVDHRLNRKVRGNAIKITWDINDNLSLTAITSYRELKSAISEDNDGSEFAVLNVRSFMDNEEYSQEFRINGQADNLDWFIGLSAYRSDGDGSVEDTFGALVTGFPFDEIAKVNTKTESYALFGDAIWAISEETNLTFGLRASYDAKSQNINNPQPFGLLFASPNQMLDDDGNIAPGRADSHENWNDISPRLVIDYQVTDSVMVFAGVSQGYKSGGFNSFPTVIFDVESPLFGLVPAAATEPFDEEKIVNIEAGIKSSLLDNRLRLNGSVFHYEFTDLQFLVSDGVVVRAENAGKAQGQGLDLEATYLVTENLTLSANLGWLNAEYGEDVVDNNGTVIVREGQDLAYAPHFTGNVALDYVLPLGDRGQLRTHINYTHTGARTHNGSDTADIYREDDFGLLSARVTFISADEHWQLAAWGTNLTNEHFIESYGGVTDSFGMTSVRRGEPRMGGVELTYRY
ncbi:TonB-dependent receptor [Pseudomaricurvus alkylphenolicus]|uniref:TonB-dependent receptor n=1 Tax=Pseudomaricurvus alkylphenolicus TaxID=1306991 RepID=UPI0014209F5E|nr:TonB-dependent receptor [Pseudomaricurvus alkylphenolicus]NIB38684.1 TonB-dependent receptor [Pseudomaricurvus alkylphenolicus]